MKAGDVTLNYVEGEQIVSKDIRACQALMTSFNRLGYTWTGGHYNLITGILRGECAFDGFVITDADTPTHMDPEQMIRAGADGKLNYAGSYDLNITDPAVYHYSRQAAHHILYTIANAKIMNGAMPGSKLTGMDTAAGLRIVLSAVSALLIALLTFFNVRRWRKKPEGVLAEA